MFEGVSLRPSPEGIVANAMLGSLPDSAMTPKPTARFPRTARLLRHSDFERVYKQGRRIFSQSMTVFYLRREKREVATHSGVPVPQALLPTGLRVGFTVGRALGGAVQRNRMKRRLREAVRMSLTERNVAVDIVINPKKAVLGAEFSQILTEVRRAFSKVEHEIQHHGN